MPIGDGTPSTPGTLLRHRPSLDRVTISCANLCKVVHACAWLCMVVHDMTVAEILKTVSKGGYLPSLDTVTISCASLCKLVHGFAWLCMVVHDMTVDEILKTVSKGGYLPLGREFTYPHTLHNHAQPCTTMHKLAQACIRNI